MQLAHVLCVYWVEGVDGIREQRMTEIVSIEYGVMAHVPFDIYRLF